MVCERPDDGIERTATQYFKRYNSKNPEKGGAKKINTGMTNQERDEQIKGLRIRFGQLLNHHLAKMDLSLTLICVIGVNVESRNRKT